MALQVQDLLVTDRLILLKKQSLVLGEGPSQPDRHISMFSQFALVARNPAPLRAIECGGHGKVGAEFGVSAGHGALTFPAVAGLLSLAYL
jgi:hypothetical protein